ncbi:DUF3617 family protein [Alphaproteobacteria bacterium KMM 3653]|uniref:DUF3617 family protein n=1 Tax=Harenicola maris TaxID=2841044 RepID=A0AAP2G793_9RHOB|nr:DUF3617 family protein [Harenicola maris]
MKRALASLAALICIAQAASADGLRDQVVALKPGQWLNTQTVFMAGREIPQAGHERRECLPQAESALTVGQYVDKFLASMRPALACSINRLTGTSGKVAASVTCKGDQGGTDMTLTYRYQRERVEVLGEGWSSYAGTKVPFKITAQSRYLGDCP